jgi:16S rRNA C967 or C1407 C5-methylase (RsmB/RsmF family)/NOL1/NOP2/fmu family ribosome biogenesis protein
MNIVPSLPTALLTSLEGIAGFDKAAFEKVHASEQRVHSIRLNPQKLISLPAAFQPLAEKVPWATLGYYLAERPSYTFDPLFHAGAYYVQEASGMFLEQVLKQTTDLRRPLKILDLCAAPGGKSTLIQSLISSDSLLVSNEAIRGRVGILRENMMKWGAANGVVIQNDPREIGKMENYFDVMVADAPCSGSGLFRRDPEAIREWSTDSVRACSLRQQRILADSWPALRKEGIMIYSTCSYSREEDEGILDWVLGQFEADSLRLQVDPAWHIAETTGQTGGYGYRFFPDKLKGEGFFLAAWRKKGGNGFHYPRSRGPALARPSRQDEDQARAFVDRRPPLTFFKQDDNLCCIPAEFGEDLAFLRANAHIKSAGVQAGRPAGKDFVPAHDLALSALINQEWPAIDLSKDEAIQYLRKQEISLTLDEAGKGNGTVTGKGNGTVTGKGADKAWRLVRYQGHNLGWAKMLTGRINNYYPKELRILKRD